MLQQLYLMTTEDVIDIDEFDYEWLLRDAKDDLRDFVESFNLSDIGLTHTILIDVCTEADNDLQSCIADGAVRSVDQFYNECIEEIDIIFSKGHDDLLEYLGILKSRKIVYFVS